MRRPWIGPVRRFARDESGGVSVFTAITLPAMVIVVGIAVDMSSLNAHRRFVQSQADLAAMSAVLHLTSAEDARAAARATVAANSAFPAFQPADGEIVLGHLDEDLAFVPAADQSSVAGVTAVAVQVRSPASFPIFGTFTDIGHPVVSRAAVAEQEPRVGFTLSNCLLSLNLYGSLIEPLAGGGLHALCSGQGLRLDAFELLDALALDATGLTPGATYGDVLDAEIRYSDLLTAALGHRALPRAGSVRLGDILHLDEDLRALALGSPVPPLQVQAADLVFGGFELLNRNLADLEIHLHLGAIARADARLSILEPRQVVLGASPRDPEAVAQTSQVRLAVEPLRVGSAFDLLIELGAANASARLADARCPREEDDLAATFDPVEASLLDIELGTSVLGLPLVPASRGTRRTSVLESEAREAVFTRGDVDGRRVERFGPGLPETLPDLVEELRVTVAGLLGLVRADGARDLPACSGLLGCILHGAAATLDSALRSLADVAGRVRTDQGPEGPRIDGILEDLLGLGLAQAQLEVLSVECSSRLAL